MKKNSNHIRIYLLGKFEVHQAEKVITRKDWGRRKAAALLQRLAFERRLIKDQVIEFLWPEIDLASGSNNLYRVIYSMRKTIDFIMGAGTAEQIFSFENGVLNIMDDVWVDSGEFESLCQIDPDEPDAQRIIRLKKALNLYEGDLLPEERYEDWTLLPREALIRLHREASFTLAKHHIEQRDFPVGIKFLLPLLSRDAADEDVHRELMRVYALSGRRHDALRQYQSCIDRLASELGVPPAQETTDLYNQILSGGLVSTPEPDIPIIWRPPTPVQFDFQQSNHLAGRQDERNYLSSSVLATIKEKNGRTVLIAGESGIGKTHLAVNALKSATQTGMVPIFGAAYEQEGRMPYKPFIEAFDHFLAEKGSSLDENPITHFQHLSSQDNQEDHYALFKATSNFLLDIAKDSPLVFLLDDLHAADETSLQLFHYLSRQTQSAPVLFFVTYQIDSPTTSQFNTLLSTLHQKGLSQMIVLESLPKEAIQEILENIFQGKVSEDLSEDLTEMTSGNPFFAQEMGKSLKRRGKLELRGNYWSLKSGEQLTVPENLRTLLGQKVSRLGYQVAVVLSAAGVIGREFNLDILRNVVTLSNEEILDALDSALAGHIIEETSSGYRFRQPLLRRTLYENLSHARRKNQHRRTAEAIEAVFSSKPDELVHQIESLAYHFELSDRRDNALPHLIQAGEKAADVCAYKDAIDYFERAISLMDDLDIPDPASRGRLLESLRWCQKNLMDTQRS